MNWSRVALEKITISQWCNWAANDHLYVKGYSRNTLQHFFKAVSKRKICILWYNQISNSFHSGTRMNLRFFLIAHFDYFSKLRMRLHTRPCADCSIIIHIVLNGFNRLMALLWLFLVLFIRFLTLLMTVTFLSVAALRRSTELLSERLTKGRSRIFTIWNMRSDWNQALGWKEPITEIQALFLQAACNLSADYTIHKIPFLHKTAVKKKWRLFVNSALTG